MAETAQSDESGSVSDEHSPSPSSHSKKRPLKTTTPCAICGANSTIVCEKCESLTYCSGAHERLDVSHSYFCEQYSLLPQMSTGQGVLRLVVFFPELHDDPQLRFEEMPSEPDILYHDIKEITMDVSHGSGTAMSITVGIDHVIRVVAVGHPDRKYSSMNRSIEKWGGRHGVNSWKGPILVRRYVRNASRGQIMWQDCTLEDFRHVLAYFRANHGKDLIPSSKTKPHNKRPSPPCKPVEKPKIKKRRSDSEDFDVGPRKKGR